MTHPSLWGPLFVLTRWQHMPSGGVFGLPGGFVAAASVCCCFSSRSMQHDYAAQNTLAGIWMSEAFFLSHLTLYTTTHKNNSSHALKGRRIESGVLPLSCTVWSDRGGSVICWFFIAPCEYASFAAGWKKRWKSCELFMDIGKPNSGRIQSDVERKIQRQTRSLRFVILYYLLLLTHT